MAREPEDQGILNSTDKRTTGAEDDGKSPLLDRRSYLKLTGATAASAVAATGMTSAANDYDVIEVGAGETFRKDLSSGETWENVLIDITAQGASYRITATADNWAIRNVGIRGQLDSTPGSQNFVVSVPSSGASGLIENVYLPGTSYSRSTSPFPSGIYVHFNHAGDLEVRNYYAANLPSHGIYGSDPGNRNNNGNGGTVRIHDSYVADTENSGFRIGSDGSYVDNCVSFRTVRGLWSRWANTEARGCDFGDNNTDIVVGQSGYSQSSTVTLDGTTCFGSVIEANGSLNGSSAGTPEERIPEGCPETAEAAASGGQPVNLEDLPENTLTITGQGEPTKYHFETSGELAQNPERGDLQRHDAIDGTTASGWVTRTNNVDGYRFDGELVDLGFDQGVATVTVNGQEVDPADYGVDASEADSEPEADHTLTITGQGEPTRYHFETSGTIERNPERGDLQRHDTIDDTTASGWVTRTNNVDGYRFDGDLLEVGFEQGAATVELDGEEIDPADYNGEAALDNLLLVDGVGTSGGTRYEFAVSGAAEKSDEKGATIDDADVIDSGTVTGSVAGWRDAFRFSGDLEDLTVDGSARVYVNGEQVDPSDYGAERPHVLTVVGNGSPANYEVTVDGTIDKALGDGSDETAIRSETVAEGSIERGVQRFRFSGTISDFTFVEGSAHVYVDAERLDPDEIGDADLLPHAIVIDGTEADGESTYSFEITGDVIASNYRDATVDEDDAIEGTSVTAAVDSGLDAYWFDGDIVDFRLAGDADVDVEYDVRSQ